MSLKDFDYHTHTKRCGHAEYINDEEYVKIAINTGYKKLGFADHIPSLKMEYADSRKAMNLNEMNGYIDSIENLKMLYANDIQIYTGLESSYDIKNTQDLIKFRDNLDYMILGIHDINNSQIKMNYINASGKINKNICLPFNYSKIICEGIKTGIFDMVSHPDNFFSKRIEFSSKSDQDMFLDFAKDASRRICRTALQYGIPLELNLSKIIRNEKLANDEYAYPYLPFWEIASKTGVKVIYGNDSHYLKDIQKADEAIKKAKIIMKNISLNIINDYDPIISRDNNLKLKEAYAMTKENTKSYLEYMKREMELDLLDKCNNKPLEIAFRECLNELIIESEQSELNKNFDLSEACDDQQLYILNKINDVSEHNKKVLLYKKEILTQIKNSINFQNNKEKIKVMK